MREELAGRDSTELWPARHHLTDSLVEIQPSLVDEAKHQDSRKDLRDACQEKPGSRSYRSSWIPVVSPSRRELDWLAATTPGKYPSRCMRLFYEGSKGEFDLMRVQSTKGVTYTADPTRGFTCRSVRHMGAGFVLWDEPTPVEPIKRGRCRS